jgi:hypothetical protein
MTIRVERAHPKGGASCDAECSGCTGKDAYYVSIGEDGETKVLCPPCMAKLYGAVALFAVSDDLDRSLVKKPRARRKARGG